MNGMAGIVLCGGLSRRMGAAKLSLPFGPETMLRRVVRLVNEAASPVVVAAAADQAICELPAEVRVVRDERPDWGPLEGLRAALATLRDEAPAAFVVSCDVPLLVPAVAGKLASLLTDEFDLVAPVAGDVPQPLLAVYRTALAPEIDRLLAAGCQRLLDLIEGSRARLVPADLLREADADLDSLANLNHPRDYLAALERAGYDVPAEVLAILHGGDFTP